MFKHSYINIIGAGLAGTEAAYQLSKSLPAHYRIRLFEMRPNIQTPAHHTGNLAELVCSNSLGSQLLSTARGLLIAEMETFDSLIIQAAKHAQVPAGQALAVDRDLFANFLTERISQLANIELIRAEFNEDLEEYLKADDYCIIASGPLSSDNLVNRLKSLLLTENINDGFLHFFDAAAPIIEADSINYDIAFKASRYNKGDGADYINCPFYSEEEFNNFYNALIQAEKAELKNFEKDSLKDLSTNLRYFDACMPIEAIAARGLKTLTFGPLKPVGLRDPRNPDRKPIAVVQLRQDNVSASLYNIVGFQTNLKWGEQKKVFSMIPGLENLEILRYGVMHQNIFINSPIFLNKDMSLKNHSRIYFAGQITGVEGYTESAASGLFVAQNIIAKIQNSNFNLGLETMLGSLMNYIIQADPKYFQPINSNWGLFDSTQLEKKLQKNKALKREFFVKRSLEACNVASHKHSKAVL